MFREIFEHSCLVSWEAISSAPGGGLASSLPVSSPDCEAEQMLVTVGGLLTDLKHYTETRRKRKVIHTVFRKFKRLLKLWDQNSFHNKISVSFKVFFREIQEHFKIFGDEMEVFLVRKVHNLGKSIVKCLSIKN